MDQVQNKVNVGSHARSIAFIALTVAIMAVSAWVTIPIGPIPVTLQMFAVTFAIVVLSPKESIIAIACYLALGAVGVPVFSGMRGGIGVLAGPTGGFLWGYLIGVAAAALLLWVVRGHVSAKAAREQAEAAGKGIAGWLRAFAFEILAGVLFTVISYVCGCVQYMAVAGVGPLEAIAVCVAPFVIIDFCKILAAVACANAVLRAVPSK
ncbi:biotin transporter BioY [Adlercreutzia sp. ZJ138]|uniref:biotin transporter BioY n=1 Tax=Adlercreutzia sp. ZJ138 TaxID=2709405 RepID=UPI0013EB1C34|nr:biotin transporter BioY [Adlercreutzia sp. ZJ138]